MILASCKLESISEKWFVGDLMLLPTSLVLLIDETDSVHYILLKRYFVVVL